MVKEENFVGYGPSKVSFQIIFRNSELGYDLHGN